MLAVAKAMGKVPYLFYTGTSTEYWTRAASPLHTDTAGTKDAACRRARPDLLHRRRPARDRGRARPRLRERARTRSTTRPLCGRSSSPSTAGRRTGEAPPPSLYPRIDRGELVTAAAYAERFPRIPGARPPRGNLEPPRLDLGPRFQTVGIIDRQPPVLGAAYVTLVPAPDADGNDSGGIRLPDVAVPLGTYTGWNLRPAAMGAAGQLARWSGSFFPFATTAAERRSAGDPRPSVEERYLRPVRIRETRGGRGRRPAEAGIPARRGRAGIRGEGAFNGLAATEPLALSLR